MTTTTAPASSSSSATTGAGTAPAPYVFIVNPRSANGATLRKFDRLREQLRARLGDVDVRLTERPRHATELTRAAVRANVKAVIAVGGDGTNNEVINGFFEEDGTPIPTTTAFANVTSGTGGDFRRTFGWSDKADHAIDRIARMQTKRIDVGRVRFTKRKEEGPGDGVYAFLNSSGFGLSGETVDVVNKSSKALGAKLSFMAGTVRTLLAYAPQRVRITLDDGETTESENLVVAICNGQYFGGGMQIAPKAEPDDGLFDYVAVVGKGVGLFARHGLSLYSGKHTELPFVTYKKCKRVRAEPVRPDDRVLLELDGEQPGVLPATWEVVPSAVSLIV